MPVTLLGFALQSLTPSTQPPSSRRSCPLAVVRFLRSEDHWNRPPLQGFDPSRKPYLADLPLGLPADRRSPGVHSLQGIVPCNLGPRAILSQALPASIRLPEQPDLGQWPPRVCPAARRGLPLRMPKHPFGLADPHGILHLVTLLHRTGRNDSKPRGFRSVPSGWSGRAPASSGHETRTGMVQSRSPEVDPTNPPRPKPRCVLRSATGRKRSRGPPPPSSDCRLGEPWHVIGPPASSLLAATLAGSSPWGRVSVVPSLRVGPNRLPKNPARPRPSRFGRPRPVTSACFGPWPRPPSTPLPRPPSTVWFRPSVAFRPRPLQAPKSPYRPRPSSTGRPPPPDRGWPRPRGLG
jgi:hypothetical protein